jgi:hypothetical protein
VVPRQAFVQVLSEIRKHKEAAKHSSPHHQSQQLLMMLAVHLPLVGQPAWQLNT